MNTENGLDIQSSANSSILVKYATESTFPDKEGLYSSRGDELWVS